MTWRLAALSLGLAALSRAAQSALPILLSTTVRPDCPQGRQGSWVQERGGREWPFTPGRRAAPGESPSRLRYALVLEDGEAGASRAASARLEVHPGRPAPETPLERRRDSLSLSVSGVCRISAVRAQPLSTGRVRVDYADGGSDFFRIVAAQGMSPPALDLAGEE